MIVADWQTVETIETLTVNNADAEDGSFYSDDGETEAITVYDGITPDWFTGLEVGLQIVYNGAGSFIRGPLRCWISYETPIISGSAFADLQDEPEAVFLGGSPSSTYRKVLSFNSRYSGRKIKLLFRNQSQGSITITVFRRFIKTKAK